MKQSYSLPIGTSIRVGDKVRVKQSVTTPRYKWGSVNHKSIGTVVSISCVDDTECKVDFPQQSAWTGLVSELEVIPALHTGITYALV